MVKNKPKNLFILAAFLLFAGLLLTTCDGPMGLGDPVDLTPPELEVFRIELADGTVIPIQQVDDKLFVGPGILVGRGAKLVGRARDNLHVDEIYIEEIGDNKANNGAPTSWFTKLSKEKEADGWQHWIVPLEGLQKGERVVEVIARDEMTVREMSAGRIGNIGPETVLQLTLLVDTDDPFVESIKIERSPGKQVDLLPRIVLEDFNVEDFDSIDYLQNENFIIRAVIDHDFSLSDVRLNFIDEDGLELFEEGLIRSEGTLYTPSWQINHNLLVSAGEKYAAGRHYMNVIITATALAGHSGHGKKDMENNFLSLCWFPESDYAKIQLPPVSHLTGSIMVEKGAVIPITVFDDDNVGEVYAGMVLLEKWNELQGTDEEKLNSIVRTTYRDEKNDLILDLNRITSGAISRTVIPFNVTKERGQYRLIIFAIDTKPTPITVETRVVANVVIMEEGTPQITISDPTENTSPHLTDDKFSIKGTVINLDPVEFIKIGWIPVGHGHSFEDQMTALQDMLTGGTIPAGAILKEIIEPQYEFITFEDGGKQFSRQEFEFDFNVLTEFLFEGVLENETKIFVIYTQSTGEEAQDVFASIRLLPYTQLPVIRLESPASFEEFSPNSNINFVITPYSESGMKITEVTLYSQAAGGLLPLTPDGTREIIVDGQSIIVNAWKATDSHSDLLDYNYEIMAKDALGNVAYVDWVVRVTSLPTLESITTSHNQGSQFSSRDEVRILARFSRAVETVNTASGTPRIRLSGFQHGGNRYAEYVSGEGSDTLLFIYRPQEGDSATGNVSIAADVANVLTAQALEVNRPGVTNRGTISAIIPDGNLANNIVAPLTARAIRIDGLSPRIQSVNIVKTNKDNYNGQNFAWHREGEVISFYLTISKPVRVMGNPELRLDIFNAAGAMFNPRRVAKFQTTDTNDTRLIFNYKVADGDLYDLENLIITTIDAFIETHRQMITDKTGAQGNFLSLTGNPTHTTNARVDSVRPATPVLTPAVSGSLFPKHTTDPERSERYRIELGNIETHPGTVVQYTLNGVTWTNVTFPTVTTTARAGTTNEFTTSASHGLGATGTVARVSIGTTTPSFYYLRVTGANTFRLYDTEAAAITGGNGVTATGAVITVRAPFQFMVSESTTYNISVRQLDRAENISNPSEPVTITLASDSALVSVICDNPDGWYNSGSLSFKLIFSGPVRYSGTGGSVTLNAGNGTTTTAITIPLNNGAAITGNTTFVIPFTWTIGSGRRMNPVQITGINLTNVTRVSGRETFTSTEDTANTTARIAAYNAARTGVRVLSIAPTITGGTGVSRGVVAPNAGSSSITLIFSSDVEAERGMIRVKPTASGNDGADNTTNGNWLIPPVLTNSEFTGISNAISSASRTAIVNDTVAAGHYVRTTHGIKQEGTSYVPDIDTKFVLNFTAGLDNAVLRPILNEAKYLWQEIEVVNDRVSVSGNTVTVRLDQLPPGRQWKVEIDDRSFRDEAGNYFRGGGTAQGADTQWGTANSNNWFWSAQTAAPVIRVERITNNRASVGQAAVAGATRQTNTRYRLDTVTPGAVIAFNTWNRGTPAGNTIGALRGIGGGVARIITTMPAGSGPYNANSNPADTDHVNSNILDATVTEITTTLQNSIPNLNTALTNANYTLGSYILGGTTTATTNASDLWNADDLYNARKDYVGARAKRSNLDLSAPGFEGIFKTIVVYRGVGNVIQENRFLRIEATNTRNGAVTIAGFPMWYNDMTGRGTRFAYRNSSDAANRNADHIFISWEIVSEFWHVSMTTTGSAPFSSFTSGEDPWAAFSADWYEHNYRKYGNWGLRVGN